MRIRRIVTRIIKWGSISIVLPLVLALPLALFAGNGTDNGNGNGGDPGNGHVDDGNGNGGDPGDGGSGGGGNLLAPAAPDNAPEINMASIDSAMALLVGGAMWLRHRK
jgi:hypothetical protein